jgi:uncharacterized membrane protein YedE/YeeE
VRDGIICFVVGVVFAVGLAIAGMTQPAVVIGFLDVSAWNPSLLFVMGAAVLVYGIAFRAITARGKPVLAAAFPTFDRRGIDLRLIAGSALFGIGWGLAGVCPGPAFASLGALAVGPVVFVAAMLAGTALVRRLSGGGPG